MELRFHVLIYRETFLNYFPIHLTMKRDLFAEMILDFQERGVPEAVERDLEIEMVNGKATTIVGPRRAGKTYFLFTVMKNLMRNMEKTRIVYMDFEDDRLLPLTLDDMRTMMDVYYEIYPENKSKKVYLFLDEVQNVPRWELFVRRVMDKENVQVFLTGSSSRLLSGEIATALRGRSITYHIFPFSFREFLRVRGIEVKKYLSSGDRARIMHGLNEYMRFGGFPEIVMSEREETKLRILKEYVDTMLMRDVVERYGIKNIRVLRILFNSLISSFSSTFSVNRFSNRLRSQGIRISKNTLYEYMVYLEDAFGVFLIRRFSYSLMKVEQSLPKVYPIDVGYLRLYSTSFSANTGRLMETIVALELMRRKYSNPRIGIFYWKNGGEVDFVVKEGEKVRELIQVTYASGKDEIDKRELRAMERAAEELRCKRKTVITWDYEEDGEVRFVPLWKWLLS